MASVLASWECSRQACKIHLDWNLLYEWLYEVFSKLEPADASFAASVHSAIAAWHGSGALQTEEVAVTPLLHTVTDCRSVADGNGSGNDAGFFLSGAVSSSKLLALPDSLVCFQGVCCASTAGVPRYDLPSFSLDVRCLKRDPNSRASDPCALKVLYSLYINGRGRLERTLTTFSNGKDINGSSIFGRRCFKCTWPKDDDASRTRSLLLPHEWRSAIASVLHDAMKPQVLLHGLALRAQRRKAQYKGPLRRRFCTDGMRTRVVNSRPSCTKCKQRVRLCVDIPLHAVSGGCLSGEGRVFSTPGVPTVCMEACPRVTEGTSCRITAKLVCRHGLCPKNNTPRNCSCTGSFDAFTDVEARTLLFGMEQAVRATDAMPQCASSRRRRSEEALLEWKEEEARRSKNTNRWFEWNGDGIRDAASILEDAVSKKAARVEFPLPSRVGGKKRRICLSHLLPLKKQSR